MGKENEIEESSFEEIVSEKRHSQLLNAIKELAKKEDQEIKNIISANTELVSQFIDMMRGFKMPEFPEIPAPKVEVELNQDKVIEAFGKMAETINDNLMALKECIENRPVYSEWQFTKKYGYSGTWDSITATAKK